MSRFSKIAAKVWCARQGSNLQPSAPEAGTLTWIYERFQSLAKMAQCAGTRARTLRRLNRLTRAYR